MKDKICLICKTAIDTDKPFCEFKQYRKLNDIQSKAYYHVNCFSERLKNSSEQSKALKIAMNTLKQVKDKMGLEEAEEVIEI